MKIRNLVNKCINLFESLLFLLPFMYFILYALSIHQTGESFEFTLVTLFDNFSLSVPTTWSNLLNTLLSPFNFTINVYISYFWNCLFYLIILEFLRLAFNLVSFLPRYLNSVFDK